MTVIALKGGGGLPFELEGVGGWYVLRRKEGTGGSW